MSPDGQRIISEVVGELERAWNAGDGELLGSPFTDDADFVTIRGEHYRTRAVIARGHQAIFDSLFKGSVIRLEATAAREVAPTVLVCHVKGTLKVPSGPLAGPHTSLATLVLVEQQGSWHIAAFHNMVVAQT